jgi:selenide,water dikinase
MRDARTLVLIGGGHSHVEVLRRFGRRPVPGLRIVVIGRDRYTPYSGMLPGLVAGHYSFDETHIDLEPLCRFAQAQFVQDEVIGLDPAARAVLCRSGGMYRYDVVSINIGSSPAAGLDSGEDGGDRTSIAVKPIGRFLTQWADLCAHAGTSPTQLRIAVVGAGAGGVEMVLAMQFRLKALLGAGVAAPAFSLFGRAPHILPQHAASARRRFAAVLAARGVTVITGEDVSPIGGGRLRRSNGSVDAFDAVLWVTSASAAPWLRRTSLALTADGFIAVTRDLCSTSHSSVFAAGDIATMIGNERPKSGVYAVRQGPPLAENLRRALEGQPLRAYRPQRGALALITTGDRNAIATRDGWSAEGRGLWRWKDWIDRGFMRRYRVGEGKKTSFL